MAAEWSSTGPLPAAVRLGFRDGSELTVDAGEAQAFRLMAELLTQRDPASPSAPSRR